MHFLWGSSKSKIIHKTLVLNGALNIPILFKFIFRGWAVLGLVLLPIVVSILGELFRACIYGGCCGETSTDWIPLIFYHLYTIIM
jgi:hypothetical protein